MKQLSFKDLDEQFEKHMVELHISLDAEDGCFAMELRNIGSQTTLLKNLQQNECLKPLKNLIVIKSKKIGCIWLSNYNSIKSYLDKIKESNNIYKITYSEDIENLKVVDTPRDYYIEYYFDENDKSIYKALSFGTKQIGAMLFRKDNEIWQMPKLSDKINKIISKENIATKDIAYFLTDCVPTMQEKGYNVVMDNCLSKLPVIIGCINENNLRTSMVSCSISINMLNQETYITGVNNMEYHMYMGKLYEVFKLNNLLSIIEKYNNKTLLNEDEFIEFINDTKDYKEYHDDSFKEMSKEYEFIEDESISLKIKSIPNIKGGIGDKTAIIVVVINDMTLNAKKLSILCNSVRNYIKVGNMIIPIASLRKAGLGKCGRLVDGTLIKDIKLKKDEIIQGISVGLFNHYSNIIFDDSWIEDGDKVDVAMGHLKFLLNYGINGGLSAVNNDISEQIISKFVRYIYTQNSSIKMIILMDNKDIKALEDEFLKNTDIIKILLDKDLKEITDVSKYNIIITSYTSKGCIEKISNKKQDIVLFTKIDSNIKSRTSRLFEMVSKELKAKVKLCIMEKSSSMLTNSTRQAYYRLFSLNYGTEDYLIRNINRKLLLPGRQQEDYTRTYTEDNLYEVIVDGNEDTSEKINKDNITVSFIDDRSDTGYSYRLKNIYNYYTDHKYKAFIREAKKYKDVKVKSAEEVKFTNQQPYFENLNDKQLKWYLYVREKIKDGIFLDTYLVCIELFLYEIINGLVYKKPEDNLYLIDSIIKGYGGSLGEAITKYRNWMFEYALVNNLHQKIYSWGSYLKNIDSEAYINYRLENKLKSEVLEINDRELKALINEDSEYYRDDCIAIYKDIIKKIDIYNRENYGQSLLEMFRPLRRKTYYIGCFCDALVSEEKSFCISLYPFISHIPLKKFMEEIIKYTWVRVLFKEGKGYANIGSLDDVYKDIIDNILEIPIDGGRRRRRTNKVNNNNNTTEIIETRKVTVSEELLQTNRQAAKIITDMLVVEGSFEDISHKEKKKAPKKENTKIKNETNNQEKSRDNTEAIFLDKLSDEHRRIIKCLIDNPSKEENLYNINKMPNVLIDEINELFMELMGDLLIIDFVVESEYLYIFK